jgi:hypothetical protein
MSRLWLRFCLFSYLLSPYCGDSDHILFKEYVLINLKNMGDFDVVVETINSCISRRSCPLLWCQGDEEWADPLIGVRWSMPFADNWNLLLRGDVGGFGVGSDIAWQARAIVDWQPWKHASIDTGFRVMAIDYETGSGSDQYKYEGTTWGPVIGFSIIW